MKGTAVPRDNNEDREVREPRNWSEWREDASTALEELDRALAQARQVIYRLRPMVRPKSEQSGEERQQRQERPVQFRRQRQQRQ